MLLPLRLRLSGVLALIQLVFDACYLPETVGLFFVLLFLDVLEPTAFYRLTAVFALNVVHFSQIT